MEITGSGVTRSPAVVHIGQERHKIMEYRVRYLTVDRRTDGVVTKEKVFKSNKARVTWLERNEDNVVRVLAFSETEVTR
jgi:hypothetical protein